MILTMQSSPCYSTSFQSKSLSTVVFWSLDRLNSGTAVLWRSQPKTEILSLLSRFFSLIVSDERSYHSFSQSSIYPPSTSWYQRDAVWTPYTLEKRTNLSVSLLKTSSRDINHPRRMPRSLFLRALLLISAFQRAEWFPSMLESSCLGL